MTESGHVQIQGLRKEFGDVTAVDGIDLEIRAGEFFTILGPSGCGKTTTLRCVAGLETPSEGEIYLNGERVTMMPANKRNTSIVFQEWALFPHMSVGENISFGLEMVGVAKAERKTRVSDVLDLVEMSGYEDRSATELSGGQKQRVAMARSLVLEPDVLLLDEPLASLDRALRERLQVELKNIQEELGITFIHVTHDQEEALTMSDRIAVMKAGRIDQTGSVTELYEHPRTRFVAEFLGETNLFEGTAAKENGRLWVTAGSVQVKVSAGDNDEAIHEGSAVAVTVRPERLAIAPEGAITRDNAWTGPVINAIYKGSNTLYEVDIGDRIVKVEQQRDRGSDLFDEGEQVTVGFDRDDGEIIPDSVTG